MSPVGAVVGSPTLTFTPPLASSPTSITVNATLRIPLAAGDILLLKMSNFQGLSKSNFAVASLPSAAYFLRASWSLATATLSLTVGSPSVIPARSWLHVSIPSSVGILMPSSGLQVPPTCSSERVGCPILLSAAAAFGQITDSPVYDLRPVGFLSTSAITCSPRVANKATDVTFSFTSVSAIAPGDSIELQMLTFQYPSSQGGIFPTLPGSIFDQATIVRTSAASVLVLLTAIRPAPGGTLQNVTIPASAGIYLPVTGVDSADATLLVVSMTLASGNILPYSVRTRPSIGAFIRPTLSVQPMTAGAIAEITLQFTCSMRVQTGEIITVVLTGFLGPSTVETPVTVRESLNENTGQLSPKRDYFKTASWARQTATLTLQCTFEIPQDTRVWILVPLDAGITVPASGMGGGVNPYTLSTNAAFGVVDPTVLNSLSTVAGILANTQLSYVTPRANAVSELAITFLSYLRLERSSTIRVMLPNFFGGKQCWDAALDDPVFQDRCLPLKTGATDDEARECMPVSPQINSFLRRDEGGCRLTPLVKVKTETFTPPAVVPPICQCLNSDSVSGAARAEFYRAFPNSKAVNPPPFDDQTNKVNLASLPRGRAP